MGESCVPRSDMRLDMTDDWGRYEVARQLFERFCEDLKVDAAKARVRLISGIQIALRDAAEEPDRRTDSVVHYRAI